MVTFTVLPAAVSTASCRHGAAYCRTQLRIELGLLLLCCAGLTLELVLLVDHSKDRDADAQASHANDPSGHLDLLVGQLRQWHQERLSAGWLHNFERTGMALLEAATRLSCVLKHMGTESLCPLVTHRPQLHHVRAVLVVLQAQVRDCQVTRGSTHIQVKS